MSESTLNRMQALERLGKRVAETQDAAFDDHRVLLSARRRWLAGSAQQPARTLGPREVLAYGVLGGVLGMALVGGHLWLTRPLSYETEQLQVRIEAARHVVRADRGQGAIRFSDGTTIWLERGAEAELSGVDHSGATVSVFQGRARVGVAPRVQSRWRFHFGPFGVRVTGTEFNGDWHHETRQFSLTLTEGSVQVWGCGMTEPTEVAEGQTLVGTCQDGRASLRFLWAPVGAATTPAQPSTAANDAGAIPASAASAPAAIAAPTAGPPETSPDAAESEPTWEELARAGSFKQAHAAVDREGFEQTCERAGPNTLLLLADVARLAGRPDRSQHALMLVRSRHAGTGASATAAFKLGRIAADQGSSVATAATWFRTYLREAPGGAFAREARGRLVEAELAMGNRPAAQQAAADYLQRYPTGPHAALARSILGK